MQVVTKQNLSNFTEKLLENDKNIKDELDGSISKIKQDVKNVPELEKIVSDSTEVFKPYTELISTTENENGIIKDGRLGTKPILSDTKNKLYIFYLENGGEFIVNNLSADQWNPTRCYAAYTSKEVLDSTTIDTNYCYPTTASTQSAISEETTLVFPEHIKCVIFNKFNSDATELVIKKKVTAFGENSLVTRVEKMEDSITSLNKFENSKYLTHFTSKIENDFDAYAARARFFSELATHRSKYVTDSSKTIYWSPDNGNDSNDGLKETTPVKSFTVAVGKIVDGDSLLIERGSVITDKCSFPELKGILVGSYGNVTKPNPLFNNFRVVDSSQFTKVNGYTNIYKTTLNFEEGNDKNIINIQGLIDGVRYDKPGAYTGFPTISSKYETDLNTALATIDEQGGSCFTGYLSGNSWTAGSYDFYMCIPGGPAGHVIEVTNHTSSSLIDTWRLKEHVFMDIDLRGSAGKDGWNVGTDSYLINCTISDICHHGFLAFNGFQRLYKCKVDAKSGAYGILFHYYGKDESACIGKENMYIECAAISSTVSHYAAGFSGHMSSNSGIVFKSNYYLDCYVEGCSSTVHGANIRDYYIDNLKVKDNGCLFNIKSGNVIAKHIRGSLYKSSKVSLIYQNTTGNINIKDAVLYITAYDGIGGFISVEKQTNACDLDVTIDDSMILVHKPTISPNKLQTHCAFRMCEGSKYQFNNCVLAVENKIGDNKQNVYRSDDTNYHNASFNNCVFFGVDEETGDGFVNTEFVKNVDEIDEIQWMSRTIYNDEGVIKRLTAK